MGLHTKTTLAMVRRKSELHTFTEYEYKIDQWGYFLGQWFSLGATRQTAHKANRTTMKR